MKLLPFIFAFIFCSYSAQKAMALDTLKLKEAKDFFADDYGNLYIYKNKDFSLTKYDSLGKQIGKMMLTVPFKIQGVQNPLTVPLFSENAQELKFVDQNLNEIQRIDFKQKFAFIKIAYAEDLQQIWLLDESSKRLIQYNFRNDTTINSYPFDASFDDLMDLLVYENKVYILTRKHFRIYSLKFEKLVEIPIENGKRFRRENEFILMMTNSSILKYIPEKGLVKIFEDPDAQIVDKNTLAYFEIKANNLYLYSLEKIKQAKQLEEPKSEPENNEKPVEKPSEKPVESADKSLEKVQDKFIKDQNVEKPAEDTLKKLIEETSQVQSVGI